MHPPKRPPYQMSAAAPLIARPPHRYRVVLTAAQTTPYLTLQPNTCNVLCVTGQHIACSARSRMSL
jgi:hypothetical protein